MKLNSIGCVVFLCAGSLWSQEPADSVTQEPTDSVTQSDSLSSMIGKLLIHETEEWHSDSVKKYNPVVPVAASLCIPGAGQVYTGHYIKAGFFIALEAILGPMAYYWYKGADNKENEAAIDRQRAASDKDPLDSANDMELSFLAHHQAMESRFSSYSFFTWTVGAHLFNVFDALGCSHAFTDTKERNPSTAGFLAAIPGLGLGQIYNGSFSKAGLVIMGQVSLGMMAYTNQRLMKRAEDNYGRLNAAGADSLTKDVAATYSQRWSDTRYRAFTNRNMYLWYSVFFYGYSIFDAVVDAYLHAYPEKMKIKPDLVINGNEITISLSTSF